MGIKLTIEEMRALAKKRGGKCLSNKYVNSLTKLKWQCAKGHVWEATPSSVMWGKGKGSWCPYCAGKAPLSLKQMQEIAARRGGKCLSKKYIKSHINLTWQCADGHVWEATPHNIKSGQWCPYDAFQNITENICREIFQIIFRKKFYRIKPGWLLNKKGNKMELDGYNEKLGLAFEYHGQQHYLYTKHFHDRFGKGLIKRIKDDEVKRDLCQKKGVRLIEIPYTVQIADLYGYIANQCEKFNIKIPSHKKINVTDLRLSYSTNNLLELRKLAESRGGKLLSETYLGRHAKLKWQCVEGHVWASTANSVFRGTWCPYDARNIRLTIEKMQGFAAKRNGKCLSKKYFNSKIKLKWQCAKGHVWEATPSSVISGKWCLKCSGRAPLTLKQMQEIAANRGGKCLSKKYINIDTKLKWQCARGHIWEATPYSLKKGTWCPICGIEKRKLTRKKHG